MDINTFDRGAFHIPACLQRYRSIGKRLLFGVTRVAFKLQIPFS